MSETGGAPVARSASRFPALGFASVLLATVLLRAVVFSQTPPLTFPDSAYYQVLAERVTHGELLDPEGARTPAYPIFLAAVGLDRDRARALQMVLGTLITAMFFAITWRITRSALAAATVALCYALNLSQVRLESLIATETLTTTCIAVALLATVWLASPDGAQRAGAWLMVAGVASALAGFTRPLFGFLPFLVLAAAYRVRPALGTRWLAGALVPLVILIGGLSLANQLRLGFFGPTTLAGYNLMNHAGRFAEHAPDRYAVVRDLYLAERRKAVAEGGPHVMVIWGAIPAMRQATGMSYAGLSKYLARMSLELFARHPWAYARSVGVAWAYFWAGQGVGPWSPDDNGTVARLLAQGWRIERPMFVALNAAFLLCAGLMVLAWRRAAPRVPFGSAFAGSVVLATSLVQALMERGDNARYGTPLQPLVALVVVVTAWDLLGRRGAAGSATDAVLTR